jgi:hypothetical protein
MDYTDPIIQGLSLFHCHLLSHVGKGMTVKNPIQANNL